MLGHDFPDDGGFRSQRMRAHCLQRACGRFRWNRCQQLAFVRDVKRIESQHFTRRFDFFADGDGFLIQSDAGF